MNLTKLFEIQKQLDERIVTEHNLQGQDLLPKKILALQVELGELANEWRGFKFWSNDQEPRIYEPNPNDVCEECKGQPIFYNEEKTKIIGQCNNCDGCGVHFHNPLLEEYVDCLHFILSIGLEKGYDNMKYEHLYNESVKFGVTFIDKTVTNQFVNMFYFVSQFENETCRESYEDLMLCFIALGKRLDFTWEQIEQAYLEKNKINHQRQESGY